MKFSAAITHLLPIPPNEVELLKLVLSTKNVVLFLKITTESL